MKLFIAILFILFCAPSCISQTFIIVSKKIEKRCTPHPSKWKGETFHSIRVKLYNSGKLNFIDNKGDDTLFLLESYEVVSGTYLGRIWNKKGAIDYIYNKGSFDFSQGKGFTNFMIGLVQHWDTSQIRTEEELNAEKFQERWIKAVRVINRNTKINCIIFKSFFKLDRDRNG